MKQKLFLTVCLFFIPALVRAETPSVNYVPGMNQREVYAIARAKKGGKSDAGAIDKQCQKILDVNFLVKADTSHHISSGDPRNGSYSVIGSRQNCRPCSGKCEILFSDGSVAGMVGYYGVWSTSHGGNGCGRYYGGSGGAPKHSANKIISKARGKKGPYLYLKSGRACYRWTAKSRRVGHT